LQPAYAAAAVLADDNLDNVTVGALSTDWVTVGTVTIPQNATQSDVNAYFKKFGFTVGTNTIELQFFAKDSLARIKSANGQYYYRKLTWTDHSGYYSNGKVMPRTVGWKWAMNDEDIWIACDTGCCVVEADK
ncbi:MAG TPA: hypothetical protein VIV65_02845, partial [Gemmatimonadaceae bacterium]